MEGLVRGEISLLSLYVFTRNSSGHSKEAYLKRIADAVLTEAASHPDELARELVVVILDQRNHGDRTVDA